MRATSSLRCTRWTIGLLLLAFAGCKADGTTSPEARLDNIAAIESELTANQARLESQGVVLPPPNPAAPEVADEDAAAAEPAVSPPPEPEPESARRSRDDQPSRKAREYSPHSPDRDSRTRCERICELADSTCDLADKICALAEEHVDDVRYEDACDRAEAQCEAASDACTSCDD